MCEDFWGCKAEVPNPWAWASTVCGLLGTRPHNRRSMAGGWVSEALSAVLHRLPLLALLPEPSPTSPHPSLWKNYLPGNWPLVPQRLGTIARDRKPSSGFDRKGNLLAHITNLRLGLFSFMASYRSSVSPHEAFCLTAFSVWPYMLAPGSPRLIVPGNKEHLLSSLEVQQKVHCISWFWLYHMSNSEPRTRVRKMWCSDCPDLFNTASLGYSFVVFATAKPHILDARSSLRPYIPNFISCCSLFNPQCSYCKELIPVS